ncbi:lysophospholipid acyltransferase family protein [Pedosphaera parvula]|uniref:Lipid A biosynthesis acyltransferase n=1 Tax=Pedosphaera parvula (strain Ellin514) TaxID=320771 RepID=B9XGH5_PEDPL|nr:lipid A biosynthesis acyltransferase [Pedosphaera parvula]EEF61026.1 lipid A biosynthesis acyltransferase [Pedosphaera parvula Ellin514]
MKTGSQADQRAKSTDDATAQAVASVFFRLYLLILRLLSKLAMPRAFAVSLLVNPLLTFPIRHQRRRNFALLFPDPAHTPQKRRQLEKDHLKYLAFVRAEMAHIFLSMKPEDVRQRSSLSGGQHLEAALSKGRGVLIIEGHSGHWNCTPALLCALGYPVTAVINPNPLRGANFRMLHEGAGKALGIKLAFVGQDAYSSAKESFRNNQIFYLNFDIAVRTRHTKWFPFGNAAILADLGPAVMALRHRVPVLYAQNTLTERGAEITLTPAADALSSSMEKPSAEKLMHSWLAQFQKTVSAQPEQWWALNYIALADKTVLNNPELREVDETCNAGPNSK